MSQDIKSLIDKINQEGIAAAEQKAREIEDRARHEAQRIVEQAKAQSQKLMTDAKEQISKMKEKQITELSQAGRDMLLLLRQEINAMLVRLINREVKDSLTPQEMFKILSAVIKCGAAQKEAEIIISLGKEDLKILEESFLAKLKQEVKREISLKASDDIQAGFVISFDAGKSQFDFSDKALAEYISAALRPKLKQILQG